MRYGLLASSAAALLLAGQPALANPAADPQVQEQAPAAAQTVLTDAQLETFADIYVEMQALEQELTQSVAEAEDQAAAREMHRGAEQQMIGIIEEHGWSIDDYNTVAQAINASPELRMQAVALINERS